MSSKQKKLHRQKLLPAIIASIFYSASVYAIDHTDTINVSGAQTVTLSPSDTVTVNNKNGIEVTDSQSSLVLNGANVSVSGTNTDTAGILISQDQSSPYNNLVEINGSQVTNQSGWGIVMKENSYREFSLNGAGTLVQGGAGAIKVMDGASIGVSLGNQAQLIGDIIGQDNATISMNISDEAKFTGNIQTGEYSGASITVENNGKFQGNMNIGESGYGSVYLHQDATWDGDLTTLNGGVNVSMDSNAIWRGDVDISKSDSNTSASTYIGVYENSHRYGQTNIENTSNAHTSMSVYQNSSWTGDTNITQYGTYSNYYFSVGSSALWTGNINLSLKESLDPDMFPQSSVSTNLSMYDQAKFVGDFNVITEDGLINHGSVGLNISDNSHFIGNFNSSGSVNVHNYASNYSSWIGDVNVSLANDENGYGYFSNQIYDYSLREGNTIIHANNGYANIGIGQNSEWRGDIEITGTLEEDQARSIYLEQDSVLTGAVKADTTGFSIIGNSTWNLTGNSALASIEMTNNSSIHFTNNAQTRAGGFHTLNVGDLKGDDSGSIHMRTDLASLSGDRLNVTNSVEGNFSVHVNNQGGAYVNPYKELTIIDSNGYQDHFQLANQVEVGGYLYDMRVDGNNLNLYTTGRPTSSAEASVNAMGAGYLMRYAETQTLQQRMGDLRQYEGLSNDVWARAYSGEFNVGNSALMSGYDLDYSGIQIGADRQFTFSSGKGYLGAMAGFTEGKQKHNQGNGTIDSTNVGVYGTYIHNNGVYVDAQLRYVHMNHDYDVRDSVGIRVDGSAATDGYAASLAVGKRFYLEQQKDEGWYVQPEVQVSTSYQNGTSFNASNGLKVDIDGYQSTLAQAGARLGHEINSANKPFNVYVKAAYVQELDSKVDFQLNGLREKEQFGNNWWTFGAGVSTTLNKQHNVFFDLERSDGATFKNPWQVNLGYRFAF